jgi:predicted ATPase
VIIRGDTIVGAGCILPLSQQRVDDRSLGTRHRAALGLTEEKDAVVVVVSEETGAITLASAGRLLRNVPAGQLRDVLGGRAARRDRGVRGRRGAGVSPRPPRDAGPPLRALAWKAKPDELPDRFPWNVPAVRALDSLDLGAPVTFFVGENGTGQEHAARGHRRGGAPAGRRQRLGGRRPLARSAARARPQLRLTWAWKPVRGFYLRAEDFFGYLKAQARLDARLLREERERLGRRRRTREETWSATDARPAAHAHVDEVEARRFLGARDTRSHGESFMELFQLARRGRRAVPARRARGAALAAAAAGLLALMHDAVREGAQFVVATHSPILLAYPGARIYGFDEAPGARAGVRGARARARDARLPVRARALLRHLLG